MKILNVGITRNNGEEKVFFRGKKRFHFFKSFRYKNGVAQTISVVSFFKKNFTYLFFHYTSLSTGIKCIFVQSMSGASYRFVI